MRRSRSDRTYTGVTARWLVALIVGAPLLVQTPASALSCVPFDEQKPYSTFAGTIVQQRGDAFQLVVREVWSGPDLTERTWVKFVGDWPEPGPAVGQAWVVFTDTSFRANTCTATAESDSVDELRPRKVRKPLAPTWWSAIHTRLMETSMLAPAADETGANGLGGPA